MTGSEPDQAERPGTAIPIALTIAGSDSSGGAGIQADLRTFSALGVYGATVITALTAQNTTGVQAVETVSPGFVSRQLRSVLEDLDVSAAKTGMLANAGIIEAVIACLAKFPDLPLIVDPVMVATSGDALLDPDAVGAVKSLLLPRATLITPNLPEAARLLEEPLAHDEAAARRQIQRLAALGARAVLLKGGHGSGPEAVDLLWIDGEISRLAGPRIVTRNTHGTGCTLSAAIVARTALGADLKTAVGDAKCYLHHAIGSGAGFRVGHGSGPVDHLFALRSRT